MSPAAVRREIRYHGRVQGVGFRFTTREIAERFRVTGFVENLPDGQVLLVAEGDTAELERFAAAIASEMQRFIAGCETYDGPATGEFTDFDIRH